MFLFENTECPVCKVRFEEGDDIVVCPDCGTPHHRACWALTGKCVNSGLHASGYSFREEAEKREKKVHEIPTFYVPSPEQAEASREEKTNADAPPAEFLAGINSEYSKSSETIEGKRVSDIAAAVVTGIPYFIKQFSANSDGDSKASWNWSAFIFGSFYFFYRKMYRIGISLMSLVLAIMFAADLAIAKLAPKFVALLQEAVAFAADKNTEALYQKFTEAANASDFSKATTVFYIMLAVIAVLRVIVALFANRLYKKHIFALIENVDETVKNGADFQSPFISVNDMSMNSEQMRKLLLARKGGVSIFAPFMAFMVAYFITYFI